MFLFENPLVKQYAVVIIVNLSVISFGMSVSWPSPVLVKLRNETETVLPQPITEEEGSWLVSIGSLVATVANFLPAILVDRIGRKYCILLGCVPNILTCFLFTFGSTVWMLMLGRALRGVGDCFILSVVPMYASEIASKEVRGALGTILQIFSSLGILIMLSTGPFISYVTLNIMYTVVTIVSTIPILFLPDSPYYLYTKGHTAESTKVLTLLRGSETKANEEIKEYSLTNTDVKIDKKDLFKNKIFLKTVGIVIVLGVGFQIVGFNAVSFYLQTILESTQTNIKPEVASVIIGIIQLFASFCTTILTDRFGRKPILTSTLVGTGLGMIGLGVFFKIQQSQQAVYGVMNYVPLVSLILVIYCYSAGPGSLYWMLITELFEGPARGIGVASSITTATLSIFLLTKYFPMLTHALGPAVTYWVFGTNCMLLALFIAFCVPETKGKSFAEIQVALGANDKKKNDNSTAL